MRVINLVTLLTAFTGRPAVQARPLHSGLSGHHGLSSLPGLSYSSPGLSPGTSSVGSHDSAVPETALEFVKAMVGPQIDQADHRAKDGTSETPLMDSIRMT